ncbi:hypothetical protein QQS21_009101 [Conoideocrella luteorostrata]|uniref:Uncharacterized protein n=1 Tax=Conoideocrella luteorostrata TaxID=1105319 RepID=A0AAJ0CHS5_9HYPO|nr:hypothetical protein QQS21_009101 [Conoideocrella luteorostrata]
MSLHILDLPVDILALILAPLLVQSDPIPVCPCGSVANNTTLGLSLNPLPILLIHPAIHAIAAPLFYEGNEFALDLRWKHGPHVRRCLDALADEEAHGDPTRRLEGPEDDGIIRRREDLLTLQSALRRIRSLEIKIMKLRGWIDGQIVPLVRDMIVSGCLAELYVKVYTASVMSYQQQQQQQQSRPSSTSEQGNTSMFTRPPLAGLFGLLSDPYLRTARLWVSASVGGHDGWRPFQLPCSGSRRDDSEDGGDLEEIDWQSIVRILDPEGRDVAVMTGSRR